MAKIVCYGNPVYDLITTPSIRTTTRVLSGCSTNACLALARLGASPTLVGTVGPDYAAILREDLSKRNVHFELYDSGQTGGFSLEYYDEMGNRNLSVLGIAAPITFREAPALKEAELVLMGPILGELSAEFGHQLKDHTSAPILFDPQGALRKIRDGQVIHEVTEDFVELSKIATILKANEIETLTATGIQPRQDPRKAVEALHRYGARISIVTLAEAGSVIFDGDHFVEIPPFVTEARDPTGAGDTYAAGFAFKYLQDPADLRGAGCWGSAVASVMVEHSGPDFPLTLKEAARRAQLLLAGDLRLKLKEVDA